MPPGCANFSAFCLRLASSSGVPSAVADLTSLASVKGRGGTGSRGSAGWFLYMTDVAGVAVGGLRRQESYGGVAVICRRGVSSAVACHQGVCVQ